MRSFPHSLIAGCLGSVLFASAQNIPVPEVKDAGLQMELFANEPLIQQPIGMTFDQAGRLLVIESHTHFRPKDWKGPPHDQIVWLQDTDGDGRADKREVVFGETDMTMDLATSADGAIYLSTRDEVLRWRDTNNDAKPDQVDRKLVWMESEGKYPHNGLSGLAPDGRGGIYLGMGENLGAAYTLHGADGTSISDQGEGGDVWHFTLDGRRLKRVATGFWNAFGVCVDPWGNVFATDNDPDSSPPCRLHHIISGGDYGYQFRYGRSGLHPFISWNGQRLGTLPMLAGTGEAPCDVICYAPPANVDFRGLSDEWHGTLLVASWVDHRIESYRLTPADGSFKAERKILCQGGADFRPVAFAVAPDGSLYVSDWVKRNYELHGTGRIWRISAKNLRPLTESPAKPYPRTKEDELRDRMMHGEPPTMAEAIQGLSLKQPYLFATAIERLSHEAILLKDMIHLPLTDPQQRAGLLLAIRRGTKGEGIPGERLPEELDAMLIRALSDADPRVLLLALHWVADERIERHRFRVEHLLEDTAVLPEIYYAALTTLARLDFATATESDLVQRLKKDILSPESTPSRRRLALEIMPDRDRHLTAEELAKLLATSPPPYRAWLLHVIGLLRDPARQAVLRAAAFDERQPAVVRAAAIAHLEPRSEDEPRLAQLATAADPQLRMAALQALQGSTPGLDVQKQLRQINDGTFQLMAARVLGTRHIGAQRPVDFTDIQAWRAYLHNLPGEPDIENGRRVFASPRLGSCASCHRADGLGSRAGPNLDRISQTTDPGYILESLLQPNRNVAPQWEAFLVTTTDGQTRPAFQLAERGDKHVYADLTGQPFEIRIDDIVKRDRLPTSIMPEGLVSKLTDEEIRDLLAFLSIKR